MNPTSQQPPVLPLDQLPSRTPLGKEFRSLHFRNGFVRMLHDVKLVVPQATPRNPLLQAQTIRFMHIHTGRLHSTSLKSTQLRLGELVQGGLLPLPPEPQRFPWVQIAHPGEKLLLLAQIDLVHPHLPQCRPPSSRRPAFQIPQIDGSHRAAGERKLSRHTSHRRTLAGQPHRLFKALAKWRLARQLRHLFRLHSAVRAAYPVQLHHDCRPKLETGQVSYFALIGVLGLGQLPPATRAHQFSVP
jgi:hypothetical protein